MRRFSFTGLMAPTVAPMNPDGSLNVAVIPQYAAFLKEQGVKGVYVNGTVGEGTALTADEREELAEAWLKEKKVLPCIIITITALSLKETKRLAIHAAKHGASGIAALPSFFDKPTNVEDLVDYCREITAVVPDTPFFYYHIPKRTDVNISMVDLLNAVADIPSFAGMKFSDNHITSEGLKCLKVKNGTYKIVLGWDDRLCEAVSLGFDSAILGGTNYAGSLAVNVMKTCQAGDMKKALEIQADFDAINIGVYAPCGGFQAGATKHAISLVSKIEMGPARKPMKEITAAQKKQIEDHLNKYGLVKA